MLRSPIEGAPLLCLCMCLLLLGAARGQQVDWRQLPYTDTAFNTDAKFDTNVTLHCNDSTLTATAAANFRFLYWIRPDMTVMRAGDAESFRILDGFAHWEVSADGMSLYVMAVQQRQFGIYLCVGETLTDDNVTVTIVTKCGLNYAAPYFGDLWPEYRTNTIVGLSAGGVLLVVMSIIMTTYHFRYKEEEEEAEVVFDDPVVIETVAGHDGSALEIRNPVYEAQSTDFLF